MNITTELNQLIAEHNGSCRDALNVTLAKLRQAQDEIALLKEAAQLSPPEKEEAIKLLRACERYLLVHSAIEYASLSDYEKIVYDRINNAVLSWYKTIGRS